MSDKKSVPSQKEWPLRYMWLQTKTLNVMNREAVEEGADYYQRGQTSTVSWIKANFVAQAFQALIVGRRADGTYWIVEGQQRWIVAIHLGMPKVPCLVFDSEGPIHEADVFELINDYRKQVDATTRFHRDLLQRKPAALSLRACAKMHGYELATTAKTGVLGCVSTMYKSFREDKALGRATFSSLAKLYEGTPWANRVWDCYYNFCSVSRNAAMVQAVRDPLSDKLHKHLRKIGVTLLENHIKHAIGILEITGQPGKTKGYRVFEMVFCGNDRLKKVCPGLSTMRGHAAAIAKLKADAENKK